MLHGTTRLAASGHGARAKRCPHGKRDATRWDSLALTLQEKCVAGHARLLETHASNILTTARAMRIRFHFVRPYAVTHNAHVERMKLKIAACRKQLEELEAMYRTGV